MGCFGIHVKIARVLVAFVLAFAPNGVAANPLARGFLTTTTGDGTKNQSLCISGDILTADSRTILATIRAGDCEVSEDRDNAQYLSASTHEIDFHPLLPDEDKKTYQCFVARVWVDGGKAGDFAWPIKEAQVTLDFSDGTVLRAKLKGVKLTWPPHKKDAGIEFRQQCGHFAFID